MAMVIKHWTFWELPHNPFTYTQAPNLCISIKAAAVARWIQLRGARSLFFPLYLPAALFKRSPSNIYNTIASSCEIKYTFIRRGGRVAEGCSAWVHCSRTDEKRDFGCCWPKRRRTATGIDKRFARHARFIAAGEIYFAIELN